jgi:Ricin-type beta-trefoil lectin domain-like
MKKVSFSFLLMIVSIWAFGQIKIPTGPTKIPIDPNVIDILKNRVPKPAIIQQGTYFIKSAIAGKNMDVKGGQNANNVGLHLWDSNGGEAQQFTIEPTNTTGFYTIKTSWGRALDVSGSNPKPGAAIVTWDFHGGDNQEWMFFDAGNSYYRIMAVYGTCIDVQNASSTSGTPIWMGEWRGGEGQKWKLQQCPDDGFKQMVYSKEQWTVVLRQAIPFAKIRLNNYTKNAGAFCSYTYKEGEPCDGRQPDMVNFCSGVEFKNKNPCDCALDFTNIGMDKTVFDIKALIYNPNSMLRVYVNDIQSKELKMEVENGKLKLGIDFESDEPEIIMHCVRNFLCFLFPGKIEVNNLHIDVLLDISAADDKITYTNVDVQVYADNSGKYHKDIMDNFKNQMQDMLLTKNIKDFVSQKIHDAIVNKKALNLEGRKIGEAQISGDNIVLKFDCK